MTIATKLASAFKAFKKADHGNVAITFAVAVVPLLVAAGSAIDFMRFYQTRTQLQAALDAGSMAAAVATNLNNSQRIKAAQDAFAANLGFSAGNATLAASFKFVGSQAVGEATETIPTTMLNLVGIDTIDVAAHTTVDSPSDKNAEIAFVLDYSGSMTETAGTQVKYIAMRNAVTTLVNNLTAANPDKLKFALVPFSDQVYTDLPMQTVYGQTGSGTWTGCTLDNPYPFNLQDSQPSAGNASKWNQPTPNWLWKSACNGYASRNLKVRPLSNDFAGVKAQIAAMTPYANTHIALGMQFGFQALSPNGVYNGANTIASYSDTSTVKYLVLLTDGTQTEPAFGPGGARDVTQGENNLVSICNNAKGAGIQILTMAVGVNDAATSARLQGCASDPTNNFFAINTTDDMARAFQTITGQIAKQAFLSK